MTRKVGKVLVIEAESKQKCSRCGLKKETRPAGPKGEELCFGCTTTDERKNYGKRLFKDYR